MQLWTLGHRCGAGCEHCGVSLEKRSWESLPVKAVARTTGAAQSCRVEGVRAWLWVWVGGQVTGLVVPKCLALAHIASFCLSPEGSLCLVCGPYFCVDML